MDEDDFEALHQRRLTELKRKQIVKQEYLKNGHGEYTVIDSEKDFFAQSKKSKNLVCHFFRDSTFRCKILDKHLNVLAGQHVETKFITVDVEKCRFLVDRLRIKVLPTLCIVKNGKTIDYVVGFDDLGGRDDFPTEMLEWRLGCLGVINYSGDLLTPPWNPSSDKRTLKTFQCKHAGSGKTIRGDHDDSDDSDE